MARIKVDSHYFPVEDLRTREEIQSAEYQVQCLLAMAEDYNEELRSANKTLTKWLAAAITDINNLCTKHYEMADDYEKLADVCSLYCGAFEKGKCFKASPQNSSECVSFTWRGVTTDEADS